MSFLGLSLQGVCRPAGLGVRFAPAPKRFWSNKGKLTRATPPLRPKNIGSIRTKLQIEGLARDLAMFNLAIESKLRGCDVVAVRVEDVATGGYGFTAMSNRPAKKRATCQV
jgi:hypothetical protein